MGGAVARNRARRLLREAWRAVLISHPNDDGRSFDVVIVARPGLLLTSGEEIRTRLTEALAELGVVGR
jgi:ribonuclease P protein component